MGTTGGGLQELNVRAEAPFLVRPSRETERRPFFLSNFDQNLIFTVETIHFFAASPETGDAAGRIASALSELLVPYDYMAGRLQVDAENGRLRIDCNGAGALFAAASSDLALAELPDITYPNPAFGELVLQEYGAEKLQDLPLLLFQVTRFKCGGFAIGLGTNHALLDGIAAVDFMRNLGSVAGGRGLASVPRPDRTCLRARAPLRIEYEHLEFTKFCRPSGFGAETRRPSSGLRMEVFPVSGETLNRLKRRAMQDGRVQQCTSFEALTAHLWMAHAVAVEPPPGEDSTVLFAVDVRSKMWPPLGREFAGNAVFPGYARATAQELTGGSPSSTLSLCVQRVQEGIARVTDPYVRSAIDWLEVYKGVPCTDRSIVVSPWKRLGFEEVEYPWGKPLYSGPVVNSWMDVVLLLPNAKEEGLNVSVALEDRQMASFERLMQTL